MIALSKDLQLHAASAGVDSREIVDGIDLTEDFHSKTSKERSSKIIHRSPKPPTRKNIPDQSKIAHNKSFIIARRIKTSGKPTNSRSSNQSPKNSQTESPLENLDTHLEQVEEKKNQLLSRFEEVFHDKPLSELLWLEDSDVDETVRLTNSIMDQKIKSVLSPQNKESRSKVSETSKRTFDESTEVWHNMLLNRSNNAAKEFKLDQEEYMQQLISGILKHAKGGGSITSELLAQYGIKLKDPKIPLQFQLNSDTDSRRKSVNINQLTSYIQNAATIIKPEEKKKVEMVVKREIQATSDAEIELQQFVESIKIKSINIKKKLKSKNMDAVEELFQMSNELRHEREQIRSRTDGNMDAFLNRGVTIKYSNELDEVMQARAIYILSISAEFSLCT